MLVVSYYYYFSHLLEDKMVYVCRLKKISKVCKEEEMSKPQVKLTSVDSCIFILVGV